MTLTIHSIQGDTATGRLTDGQPVPAIGAEFMLENWTASTSSYYRVTAVEGQEVRLEWLRTWNSAEGQNVSFKPTLSGKVLTLVE